MCFINKLKELGKLSGYNVNDLDLEIGTFQTSNYDYTKCLELMIKDIKGKIKIKLLKLI